MADTPEAAPVRVLVMASTFPASPTDPVPAFVHDQVLALATAYPDIEWHVLAPHDRRSQTRDEVRHARFTEHRFHYAPRRAERLAGRGIMPAIREARWLYLVVPLLFLGEYVALRRLLKRLRPAVVYAHWFTPQALVASWAGGRRTPFVFTTHASDVEIWHRVPVLGARLVRRATRRARALTAVSSRSMAKLASFFDGPVPAPSAIIPMGVDVTPPAEGQRDAARAALGIAPDERMHLFIGRLVEKKGVEYLIDALAGAGRDLGAWKLVIAGDGPLRAALEARAEAAGIGDRVRFSGFVSGEEKSRHLAAADVMVVPSVIAADGDAEGLPVALLEGLAAGLACVATFESGADDILTDGVDGYLVPQRDALALRAGLDAVADLDTRAASELSTRARELAARFAWPSVAEQHYAHLLGPVLGGPR
jgi:glycosyltransferase involved in cell wall biosynthesis